MSHRIQLRGLDQTVVKTLEIQPHETFLEAAIRAGLNMNYGCAGGNCGLCLARLVSGEIKQITHSDYVVSAEKKRDNYFLSCAHTASSDCILEVEPLDQETDISMQSFYVRVRALKQISDQVCILSLQPPRKHRLRFLAGQYARIATSSEPDKPGYCAGNFSIASCPCDGRSIEFHIPQEDKAICRHLFEKCSVGNRLYLQAPYGQFVFSEDLTRPLILLAVGMGFAAIKSIVEHVTAQESEVPIALYWLAGRDGHYFRNLCRSWEDALDQVSVHLVDLPFEQSTLECDHAPLTDTITHQMKQIFESEKKGVQSRAAGTDMYLCAPYFVEASVRKVFAQQAPPDCNLFFSQIH